MAMFSITVKIMYCMGFTKIYISKNIPLYSSS